MDDLIKRQDAINELSYCQTYLFDSRDHDKKISLEDAEYTIERLPSAQQWIPCSVGLPHARNDFQMREWVLTTNEYGAVGVHKYEFGKGSLPEGWDSDCEIVAWMELPGPWSADAEWK